MIFKRKNRRSERGNIFFTLFGAVAIVGLLGAAIMATMRGPLATMVEVNRRSQAEAQMSIASKLVMLEAVEELAGGGDCDGDGFVEPMEFKDPGSADAPAGGGLLPDAIGSEKVDPWGTPYGYCVWDAGPVDHDPDPGKCGGTAAKRLHGTADSSQTYTMIAIISAGKDQTFQTVCSDGPPAIAKGGDDMVSEFSYETATAASGGLWKLKSTDPTKAEIAKDLDVTGGATFTGDVNLTGTSAALKLGAASMFLPTQADAPDSACDDPGDSANYGILRVNTAADPDVVEICDSGTSSWISVAAGADVGPWEKIDAHNIYFGGDSDTNKVGINKSVPAEALDVNGNIQLTDAIKMANGKSLVWASGAGLTENSGAVQINANGGTGVELTVSPNALAAIGDVTITGSGNTDATTALTVKNSAADTTMVVRNDGNVGIGDETPNNRLSVAGNVDTTTFYKIDNNTVLRSDSTMTGTILVGTDAGENVTGDKNTVIGSGAGATLVDGENNILLGNGVDTPASDTSDYLDIGSVIIGDMNAKHIGIGFDPSSTDVTTFNDTLEVSGTIDATGDIDSGADITAAGAVTGDNIYGRDAIYVLSKKLGPPPECDSDKKLEWADSSGWSCITDLQGGSSGGAPTLEDVLAQGDDANNQDARGFDKVGADQFCNADLSTCFDPDDIAGSVALELNDLTDAATDYDTSHNMALGEDAGAGLQGGAQFNLLLGQGAGNALATGASNTGIGYHALNLATGGNNTAIGASAGDALTSGSGNIVIGSGADVPNPAGNGQLNIGGTIWGDLTSHAIGIGDFSSDTIDSSLHIQSGDIRLDGGAGNAAGCLRFDEGTGKMQFSNDCTAFSDIGSADGGVKLNAILAADDTNSIDSGDNAQVWNWNALTGNTAFTFAADTADATGNTQRVLAVGLSGANTNAAQTTYAATINNTHTGGGTNIGLSVGASGGTNNYGLLVPSGYVGIGTTAPQAILHTAMNGSGYWILESASSVNWWDNPEFVGERARGTLGSKDIVEAGDELMQISGKGWDGSDYRLAGLITVAVDGTPGANDMPGMISFSTTPDGTDVTAERMRISNNGYVGIGTPAPADLLDLAGGQLRIDNDTDTTDKGCIRYDGVNKVLQYSNDCTTFADMGSIPTDTLYINDLADAATDYNALYNMFLGEGVGDAIDTGQYNTGLGVGAMQAIDTGQYNTAYGTGALSVNTSGSANTAIGVGTLYANTTENSNTAVGTSVLGAATADYNTGVGAYALQHNTTGASNTAVGISALNNNDDGNGNAAIGSNALFTNQGGDGNVALGNGALYLSDADGNIGIGEQAGANITSGENNIIIGTDIDAPSATADNQLNIGDIFFGDLDTSGDPRVGAYKYCDETLTTCFTAADVAVGGVKLSDITAADDVNTINNAGYAQEWQWNTLAGASALKLSSTSTGAASDAQKLLEIALSGANTTGGQTTYAAYLSNTHTGSGTNVGIYANASGGTNNYPGIFMGGKVGIGTATPASTLTVAADTEPGITIQGTSTATTAGLQWLNNSGNGDWMAYVKDADNAFHIYDHASNTNPFAIEKGAPDNTLYAKSNGNVGIGTTAPGARLHTRGGTGTNSSVIEIARLENEDTNSAGVDGIGSALSFWNETETNDTFNEFARIAGVADDADNASRDGSLRFYTVGPNANSSAAATERMRINSSGLVGISNNTSWLDSDAILKLSSDLSANELLSLNVANASAAIGPNMDTYRAKGTLGAVANVASGDTLYTMNINGYNSASTSPWGNTAVAIKALVDGTPGNNDMPGRLEFYTTPDGSVTPALRMVIKNDGHVGIGDFSADTVDDALHLVGANTAIRLDDVAGGNAGCFRYNDTSNKLEYSDDCTAGTPVWKNFGDATVAGSNTQVIFNDGGAYAGDADFTWDKTNNVLSVSTGVLIGSTTGANPPNGLALADLIDVTLASPANGDCLVYDNTASKWKNGSCGAAGVKLNNILAADNTNTINNATYAQEWQWNTLAGATGLKLSTSSTAAASNAQTMLEIAMTGANNSQTTYGQKISNAHTGTSTTNVGLSASASGAVNNYAIVVPSGWVGIGTATPTTSLHVNTTNTATASGWQVGARSYLEVDPTADQSSGAVRAAFDGLTNSSSTHDTDELVGINAETDNDGTGDVGTILGLHAHGYTSANGSTISKVYGAWSEATNDGTASVDAMAGLRATAYPNNGAVDGATGLRGGVEIGSSGAVNEATGADLTVETWGGTVATEKGLSIGFDNTAGAVTDRYGIYLDTPTGTTLGDDYGIYQVDAQPNYFNGELGIGGTPIGGENKLYVESATTNNSTASVVINDTGTAAGSAALLSFWHNGTQFGEIGQTSWMDGTTSANFGLNADNDLVIFTNFGERMRFDAAGNVGIGDFSADTIDSALHIQTGDLRIDGGVGSTAGCIRYNESTTKLEFSDDCTAGTPTWNSFSSGGATLAIDDLTDAITDYTAHNISMGQGAGDSITTGSDNVFIGQDAGTATEDGVENTGVGHEALKANIGGNLNTAVGNQALSSNTTGSSNTAVGERALQANVSGDSNVALGMRTLQNNQTGGGNIAIGAETLGGNLSGNDNYAFGSQVMGSNQTGSGNIAMGYSTLGSNVSGSNNIGLGSENLQSSTGSSNLAFGFKALNTLATGDNNIALGVNAGDNITTGSNNIMIGYNTDAPSATADNQLNIGNSIYGDLANKHIAIGSNAAVDAPTMSPGDTGASTLDMPAALIVNDYQSGDLSANSYIGGASFYTGYKHTGTSQAELYPHDIETFINSDSTGPFEYAESVENVLGNLGSGDIDYLAASNNYTFNNGSGDIGDMHGLISNAENYGNSSIDAIYGVQAGVYNAAAGASISSLRALDINADNDDGAIDEMLGIHLDADLNGGTANILSGAAISADVSGGAAAQVAGLSVYVGNDSGGTIDNAVGLFLDMSEVTAGTSAYGIYQEGDVPNYLAGHLGIGTETPADLVHIYNASGSGGITVEPDETGTANLSLLTGGDGATAFGAAGATGWSLAAIGTSFAAPGIAGDFGIAYGNGTAVTGALEITSAGKVGIGDFVTSGDTVDDMLHLQTGQIRIDGGVGSTAGCIRYNEGTTKLEFSDDCTAGTPTWNSFSSGGATIAINDLTDAYTDYSGDHNLFMGSGAGASIAATGQENLFIGENAGNLTSTGDYNTGVGYLALQGNTTGYSNTAFGDNALKTNSTGKYNTALGMNALAGATVADNNTAVGRKALFATTSGAGNTAIGTNAMSGNTIGASNVAIGADTLTNNSSGSWNVALGGNSLNANTSGIYNIAIGGDALRTVTNADNNTAIGKDALRVNTAGDNVAIGYQAVDDNTSGTQLVGIGLGALGSNTTGNNNIGLGYKAGDNITTGSNNIVIGHDIDAPSATNDNQLNIGSAIYGNLASKHIALGSHGTVDTPVAHAGDTDEDTLDQPAALVVSDHQSGDLSTHDQIGGAAIMNAYTHTGTNPAYIYPFDIEAHINSDSTGPIDYMSGSNIYTSNDGAGDIGYISGMNVDVSSDNGNVDQMVGAMIYANLYDGGPSDSITSIKAYIDAIDHGDIDNMVGIDNALYMDNTHVGTVTGAQYSLETTGGATVDTAYGIYIDEYAQSGVTSAWQLYSAGTAPSYFAGALGIGTDAPDTMLHVVNSSDIGPAVTIQNTTGNGSLVEIGSADGGTAVLNVADGGSNRPILSLTGSYGGGNLDIKSGVDQGTQTGYFSIAGNGGNTFMVNASTGKVGIGDFSSDTIDDALHLVGTGSAIRLDDTAGGTAGCIRYNESTTHLEFSDDCTAGTPVWSNFGSGGGGGSTKLNAITAADNTNTINNVSYAQEWQWNSLAGATGLKLSTSSALAASNAQTMLEIAMTGANNSQTTYGQKISNAHTGSSSTNVGLSVSASGGDNNYAIIVPNGSVGIGTSTPASRPLDIVDDTSDPATGWKISSRVGLTVAPSSDQATDAVRAAFEGAVSSSNNFYKDGMIGVSGTAENDGSGDIGFMDGGDFSAYNEADSIEIDDMYGMWGEATNDGNSDIGDLVGTRGYSYPNAGTVDEAAGLRGNVEVGGGTVNYAYGAELGIANTGGAITSETGLDIWLDNTAGTVVNRYGIYLNTPTGTASGEDWAIYQQGDWDSHFEGDIYMEGGAPMIGYYDTDVALGASNPGWATRANDAGYFVIQNTTDPNWGSFTKRLVIDKDGHVGIGTDTPVDMLHLASTGNSTARFETTGSTTPGSVGPTYASTAANDSAVGGSNSWTSPGNATASDNSYATRALTSGGGVSQYIKATGFGFSVPGGATITGITAAWEKKTSSTASSSSCRDNSVMLVKGGTIGGTDKADTGTNWSTSDAFSTYGGSSDLWGQSWSASDINDSGFGVALSAKNSGSTSRTCSVDAVRVTINYTTSTGGVGCVRYNGTTNKMQYSNDCSTYTDIDSAGSGSSPWTRSSPNTYLTNSTDKVGIGTSTPSAPVEARNDADSSETILVRNDSNTANANAVHGMTSATSEGFIAALPANYGVTQFADRVGLFAADSSIGWVGSRPASGLDLVAADSTANIIMYTGGTATSNQRLKIGSDGKIGIGDFSSDTIDDMLHLQTGQIRIDGGVGSTAGCIRYNEGTTKLQFSHDCTAGTPTWSDFGSGGGGGGTPGGSDKQIQFNDGGSSFGADADFTWNKTTNVMTVTGQLSVSDRIALGQTTGADTPVGNFALTDMSDTLISSPSNGQCLVYNGTAWANTTCGGGGTLNGIAAATANQAGIANGAYSIVWNWDSLTTQTGLTLGSTSVTSGTILKINDTSTSATQHSAFVASTTGTASSAVGAYSSGASNGGAAIGGINNGTSNTGFGGYFQNTGGGSAVNGGIYATTDTTGAGFGVSGTITGASNTGFGVAGLNNSATGYGVFGSNSSSGGFALYSDGNLGITKFLAMANMSAPSVSAAGTGRIYYDTTANKFKVSQNGSAYTDLVGGGGGGGPYGSDKQIAFNDGGTESGDSNLTFDKSTTTLATPIVNATSKIIMGQVTGAGAPSVSNRVTQITTQTFTSGGTYTAPSNLLYAVVEVVGGGGGGGGCTNGTLAAAGGGGGGGYARKVLDAATIGGSQTVTVGSGGTAGANTGGTGGTGGTSSFGSLLSATGGSGGVGSTATTTATVKAGGAGGAGSSGDINNTGGAGAASSAGAALGSTASGNGGASTLGGGGLGLAGASGVGGAGGNYGGGGAGSIGSGTARVGGAGSAGIVIVTEYRY